MSKKSEQKYYGRFCSFFCFSNGAVWSFDYDALSNMIVQTDPYGNTYKNEYDKEGNLLKAIDPRGYEVTYGYDALGRSVQVTDEEGYTTKQE